MTSLFCTIASSSHYLKDRWPCINFNSDTIVCWDWNAFEKKGISDDDVFDSPIQFLLHFSAPVNCMRKKKKEKKPLTRTKWYDLKREPYRERLLPRYRRFYRFSVVRPSTRYTIWLDMRPAPRCYMDSPVRVIKGGVIIRTPLGH